MQLIQQAVASFGMTAPTHSSANYLHLFLPLSPEENHYYPWVRQVRARTHRAGHPRSATDGVGSDRWLPPATAPANFSPVDHSRDIERRAEGLARRIE